MIRIANKRDFLAGLMFAGVGLAGLILATSYRMGTPVRMGAGFFPVMLTGLLIALGTVIMISALRSEDATAPRLAWRPLLVIPIVVAGFAWIINVAGLLITAAVVVVGSRFARPGHSWTETALLALGTAILVSLVFYYGLGLNLPLWPQYG